MMKVKKVCCGKCLFGANKIVSDERKQDILDDCVQHDTHFVCHEGTIEGEDICCRAFYNKHSTNMLRISQRLHMIKFVD